jgi:tellurite resistance protein TerC
MTILLWVGFVVLIVIFLAIDLGVLNRKAHVPSAREALGWTGLWLAVALSFNVLVYFMYEGNWFGVAGDGTPIPGKQAALEFLTGYLIEYSLSLDNIFVIAMVFAYFRVPPQFQHRVLFWGILGAQAMRGTMIVLGLAFIEAFSWAVYILGGLLIWTAGRMLVADEDKLEPEKTFFVRIVKRLYPVTSAYHGDRFFVRLDGKNTATPLALALVVVESMDLLFAIDSIPAVMAVTQDPFIVFTSNVFAILGLRSLYFALAAMMNRFRYLKLSIVFILGFVGVKMILSHHHRISTGQSLAVIASFLGVGILASWYANRAERLRASGVPSRFTWTSQRPPPMPSGSGTSDPLVKFEPDSEGAGPPSDRET